MLINHGLEILVRKARVTSFPDKTTDERKRFLLTPAEIIYLIIGGITDDGLQMSLPYVIVNAAGGSEILHFPQIKISGKLMKHLQFLLRRKIGK